MSVKLWSGLPICVQGGCDQTLQHHSKIQDHKFLWIWPCVVSSVCKILTFFLQNDGSKGGLPRLVEEVLVGCHHTEYSLYLWKVSCIHRRLLMISINVASKCS